MESAACSNGGADVCAEVETDCPNDDESSVGEEDVGIASVGTSGAWRNTPQRVHSLNDMLCGLSDLPRANSGEPCWLPLPDSGGSSLPPLPLLEFTVPARVGVPCGLVPVVSHLASCLHAPQQPPQMLPVLLVDYCSSTLAAPPSQPQMLSVLLAAEVCREVSAASTIKSGVEQLTVPTGTGSVTYFRWTVDARKLQSKDHVVVSPPFELSVGRPVPFRMMLWPRTLSSRRGARVSRVREAWAACS